MQHVDLDQGLAALHKRLVAGMRLRGKIESARNAIVAAAFGKGVTATAMDTHACGSDVTVTASALALMVFGADDRPQLEHAVRVAAWDTAISLPADATDEQIINAFLERLPEDFEGTPVRARFFADAYRDVPQTA